MPEKEFDFCVTQINYVYERKTKPPYARNEIFHPNWVTGLCLEGDGIYTIDGKDYNISKGDVTLFPKNSIRSYRTLTNSIWNFISIDFDLQCSEKAEKELLQNVGTFTKKVPSNVINLFDKANSIWIGKTTAHELKCRTITQDILYNLILLNKNIATTPKHYNLIETARQYIQDHITENIDIDELVKASGLSPTHFRRLFKSIVGQSPIHYTNYIKITKAKELIEKGEMNVTQISDYLGFNNIHYFSALFKKYFKYPPSHFMH